MSTFLNSIAKLVYKNITDLTGYHCITCKTMISKQVFCESCSVSIKLSGIQPGHSNTYAFFSYQGALQKAIVQAKFIPNKAIATYILTLLHENAALLSLLKQHDFEAIFFVPIHTKRILKRGFDFSSLFAKKLAAILSLPVLDVLICKQFAEPSTINNNHNSSKRNRFEVKNTASKYTNILLVDDVITTGKTLEDVTNQLHNITAKITKVAFASAI